MADAQVAPDREGVLRGPEAREDVGMRGWAEAVPLDEVRRERYDIDLHSLGGGTESVVSTKRSSWMSLA